MKTRKGTKIKITKMGPIKRETKIRARMETKTRAKMEIRAKMETKMKKKATKIKPAKMEKMTMKALRMPIFLMKRKKQKKRL